MGDDDHGIFDDIGDLAVAFGMDLWAKAEENRRLKKYEKVETEQKSVRYSSLFNELTKRKEIGISSSDVRYQDYDKVLEKLKNRGFRDIRVRAVEDIHIRSKNLQFENKVLELSVNGRTRFSAQSAFPIDSQILLAYHTRPHRTMFVDPDVINGPGIPISLKEFLNDFEYHGYDNVKYTVVNDVERGGFFSRKKPYASDMTVDGIRDYVKSKKYSTSVPITFVYHDYM